MKTNKKVQKNNVQKSEKETGSKSNRFGNHPEADNVTHTAGRAHGYRSGGSPRNGSRSQPLRKKHRSRSRSRHRLQRPQPKQTLTSQPYTQVRIITARRSMTHPCRNLRTAFGKWASCKPSPYVHTREAVMKSSTANAATVPHCLQEQRQ